MTTIDELVTSYNLSNPNKHLTSEQIYLLGQFHIDLQFNSDSSNLSREYAKIPLELRSRVKYGEPVLTSSNKSDFENIIPCD